MVVSTNELRHHDSLLWQESGLYECTSEFINMTRRCFGSCYGNQMFPMTRFCVVCECAISYKARFDSTHDNSYWVNCHPCTKRWVLLHLWSFLTGWFSGDITTETCLAWIYQIDCVRCGLHNCVVWHFLVLWDSNAVLFRKSVLKMWSLNSIISWWWQPVRLRRVFACKVYQRCFNAANYRLLATSVSKGCLEPLKQIIIHKNIKKDTAHTIVSWPNPKQWEIVHTSNLIMIIRQSIYIISIITRKWINWNHMAPRIV